MRLPLLLFFSGLIFSASWLSCTKESADELHIDTTITGNEPQPYTGVSEVQINNYINRMYIDLAGRAPTQAEIADSRLFLESHQLDDASKDTLIQQLMDSKDYYNVLFSLTSADFINGTDSAALAHEIQLVTLVYYFDSLAGNVDNFIYYQYELSRLYKLQNISDEYMNGSATVNDYYAAFLNNYFYDMTNMGSENFVKGAFSDLYRRSPSESELINGTAMVDGNPAFMFQQDGNSKGDFITISTTNSEFYQGLVIKAYNQLLLRNATSQELTTGTASLQLSKDYPAFQKQLIKTAEYAGF